MNYLQPVLLCGGSGSRLSLSQLIPVPNSLCQLITMLVSWKKLSKELILLIVVYVWRIMYV